MTALLLRFLPHIAVIGIILGGIWYIDHAGYKRAQKDAAHERLVTAIMIDKYIDNLEANLRTAISEIDKDLAKRIADIDLVERTIIQPTIEREIRNDPRLSDPSLGITDGMFDAINRARSESACPARAAGGDCVTLSAPDVADGQVDRGISD